MKLKDVDALGNWVLHIGVALCVVGVLFTVMQYLVLVLR